METILFVCCESAVIDARTNSVSVFNIMEELNAVNFPIVVQRISAVLMLSRTEDEPQNLDLHIRITLSEQELYNGPVAVSFHEHLTTRVVADLIGLLIPAPGNLRIDVQDAGISHGHWTTRINRVGQLGPNVFPRMPPHAPPPEPVEPER
jgi:hypothetical protein